MEPISEQDSSKGRRRSKSRAPRKRKKTRKVGQRLKIYLMLLNVSLVYYLSYTLFYFVMREQCNTTQRCFLDTKANHLLEFFGIAAFATHTFICAATLVQHRSIQSKRLTIHQTIAIFSILSVFLIALFVGADVFMSVFTDFRFD